MNNTGITFVIGIFRVIALAVSFGIPFIVVDHGMAPIGFIMSRIGMTLLRPTGSSLIDFVWMVATLVGWFGWILIMITCVRRGPNEYVRHNVLGATCVFVSWLLFVISSESKDWLLVNSLTCVMSLPFVIVMCIHVGTLWSCRDYHG